MTRRRGIVKLFVMLSALSALVAASAQAAVPKSFFGVVPQRPVTHEDYDRMGQANVGTLRFEIIWGRIDPGPESGDLQWGYVDDVIASAARNGITPLPYVYSTPEYVIELDGRSCSPEGCPPFAPRGKAARAAFQQFVAEAAKRYGPGGEFFVNNPSVPHNPIRAWQIYNEQNSPSFYAPKPNVKSYAKLLQAADRGITSVDRNAEIILGGMFGTPLGGRKPALTAWDFLQKLYNVKGAKKHFDGVAAHPYAAQISKVTAQIELLRDEIKAARDPNVDLWITEIGWASGGPPNPLNRGKKGQAERVKQVFKLFLKKRNAWNIRNVDWYSWRDNVEDIDILCEWCPETGLVDEELAPKRSLAAFTRFTRGS